MSPDIINARTEALKLAYQTANEIKYLKSAYDYKMNPSAFQDDLQKILQLAEFNLKYIMDNEYAVV